MFEHVFKMTPAATITAQIDMDTMKAMDVGSTAMMDMEGNVSLVGQEVPMDAQVMVARLADDKVLVTTMDMMMLYVEDFELMGGIDKLMELAGLDSITRVSPITLT